MIPTIFFIEMATENNYNIKEDLNDRRNTTEYADE
jgi:hypothetical protein